MTTENISEVICCVNVFPKDNDVKKLSRAVYYIKDADLRTFKHSNFPSKEMIKVGEDVENPGIGPWEPWVSRGTYNTPSRRSLQIVIFPRDDGKRFGGAASIKDDSTKSIPKIFRMYPGKQRKGKDRIPLWESDGFRYYCVYYGTRVDIPIPALDPDNWETNEDKRLFEKDSNTVPLVSLEVADAMLQAAMLQGGNVGVGPELQPTKGDLQKMATELQTTIGDLRKMTTELQTTKGNLGDTATGLTKTKGDLQNMATELGTTKGKLGGTATELEATKGMLGETATELQTTKGMLGATATELETTKRTLGETATELQTTKGMLGAAATELHTTKGKLGETATELQTTKGKLGATATELETTKRKLGETATELHTTKGKLGGTATELETTKRKLGETATELYTTKGMLGAAAAELHTTKGKLGATATELETTKGKLGETATELETTKGMLGTTAAELEITKKQLETTKEELRKGLDKLKVFAKAVAGAVNDLGNYDNIKTPDHGGNKNNPLAVDDSKDKPDSPSPMTPG